MRKLFLIPLLTLLCTVMAWAQNPTTAADLQTAVNNAPDGVSTTITLGGTIDGETLSAAGQVLNIPANKVIVLDLAGFDITANLQSTSANYGTMHVIKNAGQLTITGGGKIKNTQLNSHDCTRAVQNDANAVLNLNNCEIIASKMGVNNAGHVNIGDNVKIETGEGTTASLAEGGWNYSNGGTALQLRSGASGVIDGENITIKSHKFNAVWMSTGAISLVIKAGTFEGIEGYGWLEAADGINGENLKLEGGTYDVDPADFVAQGYYVAEAGSVYNILRMPDPLAYTVNTVADMETALAQATNIQVVEMTLGSDIVLNKKIELPHGSQLIIPAGRTFTVQDGGLFVNEGITTAEGTIVIQGTGFFSYPSGVEYSGAGKMEITGYSMNVENNVVQYAISTPMQLQYLSYLVRQDAYQGKTWNITLNTDLTLPSQVNFDPIAAMSGVFDGQNHSISGLYGHTQSQSMNLFGTFRGTVRNLNINNIDIETVSGNAAGLCGILKAGSIVENVTLQGAINSTTGAVSGFVKTCESLGSAASGSEMDNSTDKIWFVNCVNDIDIHTGGINNGAFIGTVSGAKGVFGFYNCSNKGSVYGRNVGELFGHGNGSGGAKLELVAFTPSGEITPSTGSGVTKCGIANLFGASDIAIQLTSEYNDEYDPATYTAVWNGEKYIATKQGILDNTGNTPTTDWAQNTTWTTNDDATYVVPNAADNVTVNNNEGVIVTTGDAEAKQVTVNTSLTVKDGATLTIGEGLTIASTATVTVEQGATLVIGEAGLTNNGKLEVKGTVTEGAGVVLFDPEAPEDKTQVAAEISITPDAHKKGENSLLYRYIGIPLYFEGSEVFVKATNWAVSDPTATIYFQEWNPLTGWNNLNAWADLVPFKGYATSNSTVNNLTYTFKGNLVGNANQTLSFAYGFNMYANSYTAPIQIQTLLNSFDENVNATIYMFDDGVVKSVSKSAFNGYEDPEFTSIPSLQAFFVLMENENTTPTENINYANTVYNFHGENDAFYAPARNETPDFNRVRINVANENGANDAVYMIEAADFTNEFDNGYDAVKYMNTGLNLFATTAHGRQSSNYSNSIEGSFIGVQGNGTYTMSFDKLAGEEYQIRDLENDAVITMSENNTYTFTVNGTNEARFVVEKIHKIATGMDNIEEANLFVSNNTLFVGANNADIQIFAANGQLVIAEKAQATVDLSGLAAGVYTVRVANQTLKFVK